jgi:SHS2 domain-containing protein
MTILFEQLPHTADIKLRAYGSTKQELFKNAMYAMFESTHPIIDEKKPKTSRIIVVDGQNLNDLFINFLADCLYLSDTHREIYRDIEFLEFTDTHIHASLIGTPIQGLESAEIKAVTHHDFMIEKKNKQFIATFVLDI